MTISHLKDIRKKYKPNMMVLVETKNMDSFVHKVVEEHSFVVSAKGTSGGLVIMWNDGVKVRFLGNPTLNATDMYIEEDCNVLCLTYIYGHI